MTKEQKNKLIEISKNLIGKPYKYGASPEEAPECFDCSLFVQYVFKQIGIELPRSSILQAAAPNGKKITPTPDFSNLEVGDLLFMRGVVGHYKDESFGGKPISIGHVVIYIGNGEVIQAREKLNGVAEQPLAEVIQEPNYQVVFVKRF